METWLQAVANIVRRWYTRSNRGSEACIAKPIEAMERRIAPEEGLQQARSQMFKVSQEAGGRGRLGLHSSWSQAQAMQVHHGPAGGPTKRRTGARAC